MKQRPVKSLPLICCLVLALLLTACQRTIQISYDPAADPFQEAELILNTSGINYNPDVEKMVVVALSFNDGTGILQEHQLYDFSTITVQTVPGGKVILSLPKDPAAGDTWTLLRNENKTSSQAFAPMVMQTKPGQDYSRVNILFEPVLDTDVTAVLEDEIGNRKMTLRLSIRGTEQP